MGNADIDLLTAVMRHDVAAMREALGRGANVNCQDQDRLSPLLHAVFPEGDVGVVGLLLESGADPRFRFQAGTVIGLAARAGNLDVVKLLIQAGADPREKGTDGEGDAFEWAELEGHEHILDYLRQSIPVEGAAMTIFEAIERCDDASVESLLAAGADPNEKGLHGCSPVHIAAEKGLLKLVQLLLMKGGDARQHNNDGDTPLHLAAVPRGRRRVFAGPVAGNLEVCRFLLEAGISANIRETAFGGTPLHRVAGAGNVPMAELLLHYGATIDLTDSAGRTPLYMAIGYSPVQEGMVQYLLAKGANPNPKPVGNLSLLGLAERVGAGRVVELLRTHGAN